jgi:hypothetical protein
VRVSEPGTAIFGEEKTSGRAARKNDQITLLAHLFMLAATGAWDDLLPELRDIVLRTMLDRCGRACLAMTCRDEAERRHLPVAPSFSRISLVEAAVEDGHLAILDDVYGRSGTCAKDDCWRLAMQTGNRAAVARMCLFGRCDIPDNLFLEAMKSSDVAFLEWLEARGYRLASTPIYGTANIPVARAEISIFDEARIIVVGV